MEHEVTLLIGINGSIELISRNENGVGSDWAEIISLGLLLVCSTVFNLSIACAVAVGQAKDTLDVPSTVLIQLSIVNAIDAMLSQSLSLAFMSLWSTSLESPPIAICHLSAGIYTNALLVPPLYLLVVFFHGFFQKRRSRDSTCGTLISRLSFAIPPLAAIALSCPFVLPTSLVRARVFINRYACCIIGESLPYSIILVSIGFFVPWAALAYCMLIKNCSFCGEGVSQQCCWGNRDRRFTSLLVALAAILVLPSTASFCVSSMTEPKHTRIYQKNDEDDGNRTFVFTGPFDTALVWLRFFYNPLSPLVMLIYLKDLRLEWKRMMASLLFCTLGETDRSLKKKRKSKENLSKGGPVLCATQRGLVLLGPANGSEYAICDLFEEEQNTATQPSTSTVESELSSFSPPTSSSRKSRPNRKKPLKVVRFAQSIKEIPP